MLSTDDETRIQCWAKHDNYVVKTLYSAGILPKDSCVRLVESAVCASIQATSRKNLLQSPVFFLLFSPTWKLVLLSVCRRACHHNNRATSSYTTISLPGLLGIWKASSPTKGDVKMLNIHGPLKSILVERLLFLHKQGLLYTLLLFPL